MRKKGGGGREEERERTCSMEGDRKKGSRIAKVLKTHGGRLQPRDEALGWWMRTWAHIQVEGLPFRAKSLWSEKRPHSYLE